MKGTIFIIIVLAIIVGAATYQIFGQTLPAVTITKVYGENLQAGQIVDVDISLVDTSNVVGWSVNLAWDPYVLQVQTGNSSGWRDDVYRKYYSIFRGTFLKDSANSSMFTINTVDNQAGTITLMFEGITEIGATASGSGVVAIIRFVCVHAGITTVEITGPNSKSGGHSFLLDYSGANMEHRDINGIVTDAAAPPVWTAWWFQVTAIVAEVAVLAVTSYILYRMRHPRLKRTLSDKESEEILI